MTVMAFSDLIIIYLSLAAPFGAHSLITSTRETSEFRITDAAAAFFFWPIYGSVKAARRLFSNRSRSGFAVSGRSDSFDPAAVRELVADLRLRLLQFDRTSARDFLEALERYAEIGLFIRTHEPITATSELFAVAGHPSPKIATKCADRRNLRTSARHHTLARADLVESAACLNFELQGALGTLADIAAELGDTALESIYRTREGRYGRGELPTDPLEQLQWGEPKQSIPGDSPIPIRSSISSVSLQD
jgi:hypothetical protein